MLNTISVMLMNLLMYSAPIALAAIGGVISERSGIINIGIEGMMSIGAFTGATVGYFTNNAWLGFLCAGIAGAILALLHAAASITFLANQTVSGIAINLLGPGIAIFFAKIFFSGSATTLPVVYKLPKISLQNYLKSGFSTEFSIDITAVIAIIVTIITWFVLQKTNLGLRIKATGEHPAAVDTLGVSVKKIRYTCTILSGFLAGLGGGAVTLAIISHFTPISISGQGFIALAAIIFGKWRPFGAYCACLLFGLAQALVIQLSDGNNVWVPSEIIAMLPYVLTILILVIFVGKSYSPKALGQIYEKGEK